MSDVDVVVIGSGAGGLGAALACARAGEKVLVLEQHQLPGGWCQTFPLEGYHFSPGVHYVGALHPGGFLRRTFEGLGVADDLAFGELNPEAYDRAYIAGERFDIPKGKERWIERLQRRFPDDAEGIARCLNLVEDIGSSLMTAGRVRGVGDAVKVPLRMRNLLRYGMLPWDRFLRRFVKDPAARTLLSIQGGDHGMLPSKVPVAQHAAILHHYLDGGYYPIGGGRALGRAFIKNLRRHGGQIRTRSRVERVLLDASGAARGVRLADGTEISAGVVVSNADPAVTYRKLVGDEHLGRRLKRKLDHLTWSCSSLSLFLAADFDARGAGLDSGNVWFSRRADAERAFAPVADPDPERLRQIDGQFLTVTTLKDPLRRRDGIHTMESFVLVHHDMFRRWNDTRSGDRPAAYRQLKERIADSMFSVLEELVPGLRSRVVFHDLATPLTNRHYLADTVGAAYGTEKRLGQIGPWGFPVRTEIPGLFHCGASTLGHGVAGALMSGLFAASAILDCRLRDLLDETGQRLLVVPCDDPAAWPERLRRRAPAARQPHAGDSSSPRTGAAPI
jgi:phytoene dehydrogenase-like protein